MRTNTPAEAQILALIDAPAEAMGYRIVRVRLMGLKRKRLQIMAERLSDGHMGIDDCGRLSRTLSPIFDEADPIKGEFDLEVSSPGIDRPLMRVEDFERFVGHDAKLELVGMIDGRKRFRGPIDSVEGEIIRVRVEDALYDVPFSALSEARLVLTDRLIAEDLKRAKHAADTDTNEDEAEEAEPAPSRAGAREPQKTKAKTRAKP